RVRALSGARFAGCWGSRRSRASMTSLSSGKQSHTLVIHDLQFVARMERSEIRGRLHHGPIPADKLFPHFAALHAGYGRMLWPDPRRLHLQPARAPHQVELERDLLGPAELIRLGPPPHHPL